MPSEEVLVHGCCPNDRRVRSGRAAAVTLEGEICFAVHGSEKRARVAWLCGVVRLGVHAEHRVDSLITKCAADPLLRPPPALAKAAMPTVAVVVAVAASAVTKATSRMTAK